MQECIQITNPKKQKKKKKFKKTPQKKKKKKKKRQLYADLIPSTLTEVAKNLEHKRRSHGGVIH